MLIRKNEINSNKNEDTGNRWLETIYLTSELSYRDIIDRIIERKSNVTLIKLIEKHNSIVPMSVFDLVFSF